MAICITYALIVWINNERDFSTRLSLLLYTLESSIQCLLVISVFHSFQYEISMWIDIQICCFSHDGSDCITVFSDTTEREREKKGKKGEKVNNCHIIINTYEIECSCIHNCCFKRIQLNFIAFSNTQLWHIAFLFFNNCVLFSLHIWYTLCSFDICGSSI